MRCMSHYVLMGSSDKKNNIMDSIGKYEAIKLREFCDWWKQYGHKYQTWKKTMTQVKIVQTMHTSLHLFLKWVRQQPVVQISWQSVNSDSDTFQTIMVWATNYPNIQHYNSHRKKKRKKNQLRSQFRNYLPWSMSEAWPLDLSNGFCLPSHSSHIWFTWHAAPSLNPTINELLL